MEEYKQNQYRNPARAIFTGIKDLFKKRGSELDLNGLPRLDGKKIMITGASSGLGFATAVELAKRGAEVIMAVRSGIPEKGEEVKRISGSDSVHMIFIDLTDLDALIDFPRRLKEQFGPMDIIICNAAVVKKQSRLLKAGLDEMFVVNYFAKFLLVNQLIKADCLNTKSNRIPRIIFVASESHRNPEGYEWETFGKYEPYGINKTVALYGYYKLLLVTLANELSRRLNPDGKVNCSVFALCPGPVNTNIAREAPAVFQPLLKIVFWLFFRSPRKASSPVIYLSSSEEMEGRPIDYLFLMNRKPMDPKAVDPENGHRLWELSERLREMVFNSSQ